MEDFIIEDENYFGGQSIIRKQSGQDDEYIDGANGSSQQINLSEYLDQAYNKFDPDF